MLQIIFPESSLYKTMAIFFNVFPFFFALLPASKVFEISLTKFDIMFSKLPFQNIFFCVCSVTAYMIPVYSR
ncbi:hypothetical protein CLU79DRAFT_781481 [Phycomyces nitens]|nr:hypothetical protein CLU79DRAFT_781481 [Phycomyces nitens]